MKFVTIYCLAMATCPIASLVQAARATKEELVNEESSSVINGQQPRNVQILELETDPDAIMAAEIVVEINDPESITDKKLKGRINTTSANNVGYGKAIPAAVDAAYMQAKQIKNWNKAYEAFMEGMTSYMALHNLDYRRAKAAVCYNQGYSICNPSNYYRLKSTSFSSGLLKTNYDCFYLENNNAFWYDGDGGY